MASMTAIQVKLSQVMNSKRKEIFDLDQRLEKPDPRTDSQKIKDDFEKALQKYKKEQH